MESGLYIFPASFSIQKTLWADKINTCRFLTHSPPTFQKSNNAKTIPIKQTLIAQFKMRDNQQCHKG